MKERMKFVNLSKPLNKYNKMKLQGGLSDELGTGLGNGPRTTEMDSKWAQNLLEGNLLHHRQILERLQLHV